MYLQRLNKRSVSIRIGENGVGESREFLCSWNGERGGGDQMAAGIC